MRPVERTLNHRLTEKANLEVAIFEKNQVPTKTFTGTGPVQNITTRPKANTGARSNNVIGHKLELFEYHKYSKSTQVIYPLF
jgi:hypothetical protein